MALKVMAEEGYVVKKKDPEPAEAPSISERIQALQDLNHQVQDQLDLLAKAYRTPVPNADKVREVMEQLQKLVGP
jgi:hypothetical protein